MAVDKELVRAAVARIAEIDGIEMSPEALVEDTVLLAVAWPEEDDFAAAVASTVRTLCLVVRDCVIPSHLDNELDGWLSYHCQLHRIQGCPSHLRVVYRRTERGVEIMGFGHRFKPTDIYRRLVRGQR